MAALLFWSTRGLALSAWSALRSRIERVVEGPPVPASKEPMQWASGIPRRGLLLKEDTRALDRPDGSVVETVRHRMFVDIYDVWPLSGEPTHYRVGNRQAVGWVRAGDLLPWSTRLVRGPDSEPRKLAGRLSRTPDQTVSNPKTALPILEWTTGSWIREAVWKPSAPWSEVRFVGWEEVRPEEWDHLGLLLTREELLELIRLLLANPEPGQYRLRVRAGLGRLLLPESLSGQARAELAGSLPRWFYQIGSPGRDQTLEALGRLNDDWKPVASWESLEFAFVPLSLVP